MKQWLLAFTMLTSGCAVYAPRPLVLPVIVQKQYLSDVTQPNLVHNYNAMPSVTIEEIMAKVARRNQVITEMVSIVDQNYRDFETRFWKFGANLGLATDIASLGLNAGAAVSGDTGVQRLLAVLASTMAGSKASYDRNYFTQQTRPVLMAKMRALRDIARLEIETQREQRGLSYSMEQAMVDVQSLYDAGTIPFALQSIATEAGAQSSGARQGLKALRSPR